ncbi:MAG: S41 family peptidase, partial [Pseudomonadota bacterium]
MDVNRRSFVQSCATMLAAPLLGDRPALASIAAIERDVGLLRRILELHPGALRYQSPMQLEAGLAHLGTALAGSSSLDQQFLALQRFLSTLQCGHTYANFFNQTKEVQSALFDRPTRLPFVFRWLGAQMVVTVDALDGDMPRGSVITAINGVAPSAMLERLLPFTRADGAAPGKRKALLEVQNRSRFEYFDVFHGLIYGEPSGGMHTIAFRHPKGETKSLEAAPITLAQRQEVARIAKSRGVGPRDDANRLGWRFVVRSGVGVLTMPTWAMYSTDWDWRSWLDDVLDEAADLRGLIIDNRDNEGGLTEVRALILSRLIRKPIQESVFRRLVKYRTVPEDLRPFMHTWDESFYLLGEQGVAVDGGFYELPSDTGNPATIEPRGRPVDTPSILLTSPTNSSATFQFAQAAKATGRFTLIGEETGGSRKGINGDGFFFTT